MRFVAGFVFTSETTVHQSRIRRAASPQRRLSRAVPGPGPPRRVLVLLLTKKRNPADGSQCRCRLKHITVLGNRRIQKFWFFSLPQSRSAVKAFCKCSPSSPTDARCVVACGFLITEALSSLASLSSVCRLPLGSRSIYSHDKTSSGLLSAEMRREPGQLAGPGRPVSHPGLAGGGAELDHENRAPDHQHLPQQGNHRAGGPPPERGVLVPRALVRGAFFAEPCCLRPGPQARSLGPARPRRLRTGFYTCRAIWTRSNVRAALFWGVPRL